MEAVFDSLTYFKKLKDAGVPEEQANVQAEALRAIIDSTLATKKDLKEQEYRIIIRLGSIVIATAGICTTIVLGFLPLLISQ